MSKVINKIALDILRRDTQVYVSAYRGDTMRAIVVSLTEGGKPFILPNEGIAIFTATKPDGNHLYNECRIDRDTNTIVYDFTPQTAPVKGEVKCQFKLTDAEGDVLACPSFSIIVDDTLYNEEPIMESSEEYTALTSYLASLPQYVEDNLNIYKEATEKSAKKASDSAERAHTSALSAESSACFAEDSSTTAQQSAGSAEASASSAKASATSASESSTSASNSASAASVSAASAKASEENAKNSETASEASASAAKESETSAGESAKIAEQAALLSGESITVFDDDNNKKFLAQIRIVNGKPVIEYTETATEGE